MQRTLVGICGLTSVAIVWALATQTAVPQQPAAGRTASGLAAPEFNESRPDRWLNSKPLQLRELRGRVVLLDVWTTDCWNCYRSFPWLRAVDEKFSAAGLAIVGVHSPEFEREKNRSAIAARLREYRLGHPQLLDDEFTYWKKLNNRYWPAFYLIDKRGVIRELLVGEQHVGGARAKAFEQSIAALLTESAS
jgi:thiol-disulfide isomerase/thioredoxin